MNFKKEIMPAPSGINDYWNWNRDTTKHPKTQPPYPTFTRQQCEEIMDNFHKNGFGG